MNNEFSLFYKKFPIYLSDESLKIFAFKIAFKTAALENLFKLIEWG